MNNSDILSTWNLVAEITPSSSPRVTHLQTPSGRLFLKESESVEAAERHLDLLEHLAGAGLPAPRFIPTRVGERYVVAEGKAFWLSRELPGHHFVQFQGPAGIAGVERLASSLSDLHRTFVGAPGPERFPVFRDELIFLRGCLENRAIEAALMNQDMLFWFEDHRREIEAAVVG